jgi:ATP-binding cassette subfamily B protein
MFRSISLNEAPICMNYNLNQLQSQNGNKSTTAAAFRKILPMLGNEKKNLLIALAANLVSSGLNLAGPILIGYTIDHFVTRKQYHGVLVFSGILVGLYLGSLVTSYFQTRIVGSVGQRMLFNLRNEVFSKLQHLPVAFFNQNKAGDLISRINNDTDKLNQFFSQSLMQFIRCIFLMVGAGIFLLSINARLGAATLAPALLLLLFTRAFSPWVKRNNAASLKTTGGLSAEIQESLNNFKVIIAFNRRDYFRKRFDAANRENYGAAIGAGLINNIFLPVFSFSSNLGQLIVLALGIYLISMGQFTIGLLISFLAYANSFYSPIQQLASLWANFQVAMAAWDRISYILNLSSNLDTFQEPDNHGDGEVMSFKDVHFSYPDGKEVLHGINFNLKQGKTYALVGPTGGGKTTTASLIARLYDPTQGIIKLEGRDIRSYRETERTKKVGFILQDPFLFTGTIRENIVYANEKYLDLPNEKLEEVIRGAGLHALLERFDQGLDTPVTSAGDGISLGQKQLIAFMRAVLRNPDLLILDEATANIDTMTEQLLQDILLKLPPATTRVIIAHRLNTIENADEIYFVNAGNIIQAGSFGHAMKLLMQHQLES